MKKIFTSIVSLIFASAAFAMPVFKSYLPDTSGEYLYYRDYSFERESYVGILYYDDETFQLRYYAPQNEDAFLTEKDIELLVSADPKADHLELTGERFLSHLSPSDEDTEIVNYLHDLLYELFARRSRAEIITYENQNEKSGYTDFMQFGGNVKIIYDCTVPLFNLRTISSEGGDILFNCVTFGQIKNTADTSFSDFKGFNFKASKSDENPKIYKKSKEKIVLFEKQSISLDKNWTQQLENFWTLNEDSLIALSEIPDYYEDFTKNSCFLIRKLLLSSENSYTDFASTESFIRDKSIKIISKTAQTKSQRMIVNTKILTKNPEKKSMNYFSIATYESAYKANQGYFEKIIKSYKR